MKRGVAAILVVSLPAALQAVGMLEVRAPGYGWQNGEYTTSHVFVDEVAGTTAEIEVRFEPGVPGVVDVEVFTNLNRRDLAVGDKNGDGEHDGVLPPDAAMITDSAADTDPATGHYFIPVNMTDEDSDGVWEVALPAAKTGAYRLTARFKTATDTEWQWYGLRDHCVVVTPVTARDIRMYEVNVFNMEASGTDEASRSTWEDLADLPGALHTTPGRANDWNLSDYMGDLRVNWLWFQPYHPYGEEGRHLSAANINARDPQNATTLIRTLGQNVEDEDYPYALGSPYAVKNFFEIEPRTSANYDATDSLVVQREKARQSFVDFVAAADSEGVNLMPDAAFNHAAWDMELGPAALGAVKNGYQFWGDTWMDAQGASGWGETDLVHDRELRVFSRAGDYRRRAFFYNDFFDNNVAPGPDRTDFNKWLDVVDIFYGRYTSLVGAQNGSEVGNLQNEGDWFDYTSAEFNGTDGGSFDAFTRATWRYFAQYAPYWIAQSRPSGENRNSTVADGDEAARYEFDARGIDGLRCDFGQGIPPQAWEYIINVARSYKWSFVFMAESLDGGAVTYRSARHFDILNENIVFAVKGLGPFARRENLVTAYESRRAAYGQALVLLNTVSHDEDNYADPFVALANYLAHAAMDGAPMIFPGQEQGISTTFGYDLYERNVGKFIPHFKTWNSMMPAWADTDFGNGQLYEIYAAANRAREESRALRSSNRFFLTGEGGSQDAFGVAKVEEAGASPARSDVVLAFANLYRDADVTETFKLSPALADDLGLTSGRTYNVKNRAAYTGLVAGRDEQWLWGDGAAGEGFGRSRLLAEGFTVGLKKVPASAMEWEEEPFEAQYLKVYDVTPPPAPRPLASYYGLGSTGVFRWEPSSAGFDLQHDVIVGYQVRVLDDEGAEVAGGLVEDGSNEFAFTGVTGEVYRAEIKAVSLAGVASVNPGLSDEGAPDAGSATTALALLDPAGDEDGDGQSNASEDLAGTNPLDGDSVLEILSLELAGENATLEAATVSGRFYHLQTSTDLLGWSTVISNTEALASVTSFLHSGGAGDEERFYRVMVTREPVIE